MITLVEHKSSSYAPRTWHNASQGVTLAYAVDHHTAGEKLTQKAAKGRIVMVAAQLCADLEAARKLYSMLRKHDCHTVNVAGNGIYTFAKHGFGQLNVNEGVYRILSLVHQYWPIEKVVSGGQSGADIAGLIAAERLGIPSVGTWPKGYKMRFSDGVDRNHTQYEIIELLRSYQ